MTIIKKFSTIILCVFLILFTILSSVSSQAQLKSELITKRNTTEKLIAFTFDGGSDAGNANEILDILKESNIKSTFFITGKFAEKYPSILKRMINEGHELGNHSYDHPYFTTLPDSNIKTQLSKTEEIIKNLTGKTTKPYFRPPYGAYNSHVLEIVGYEGYDYTIYWNIDTLDWKGVSASYIRQRVMDRLIPGSIVLMHLSGVTNSPNALRMLIPELIDKGYKFVKISELLDTEPSPYIVYTVKRGDTLYRISRTYSVTIDEIVNLNNIKNPNLIYVNQKLLIPKEVEEPSTEYISYIVKRGDTLYRISRTYNVTIDEIVKLNNIKNPNLIYVNQKLLIPKEVEEPNTEYITYTVVRGDTLYKISKIYNVTIDTIVKNNNIKNPNLIFPGQRLKIPQ